MVVEIVSQIRRGQTPDAVLEFVARRDAAFVLPNRQKAALEMFLVNLAHSTGSLQDVVRVAMESTASISLPSPQDFRGMCNRIVYLPYMESMLRKTSGQVGKALQASMTSSTAASQMMISKSGPDEEQDYTNDGMSTDQNPPYHVPAAPWTDITASGEAVSHLVSLFLTWINPTWRFVEVDLFLHGESTYQEPLKRNV